MRSILVPAAISIAALMSVAPASAAATYQFTGDPLGVSSPYTSFTGSIFIPDGFALPTRLANSNFAFSNGPVGHVEVFARKSDGSVDRGYVAFGAFNVIGNNSFLIGGAAGALTFNGVDYDMLPALGGVSALFDLSNFTSVTSSNFGQEDRPGVFGPGSISSGFKMTSLSAAGAVPEAATWALMILGMGAVGYGMRRRNATVKPAVNFWG